MSRQVLICGGPRCDPTRRQADALVKRVNEFAILHPALELSARRTLCTGACESGPTLIVQPEGVWYRCENAAVLERIMKDHLEGGAEVAELVFHRD